MILIYSIRTTQLKAELALATMGSNYFSKNTHLNFLNHYDFTGYSFLSFHFIVKGSF